MFKTNNIQLDITKTDMKRLNQESPGASSPITVSLSLPRDLVVRMRERAAGDSRSLSNYAALVLEQAVTVPTATTKPARRRKEAVA